VLRDGEADSCIERTAVNNLETVQVILLIVFLLQT